MNYLMRFCLFLCLFGLFTNRAIALDVLYPQQKHHSTISNVTYVMGNVHPTSELTINGEKVKVWPNGAYCKTCQLKPGHNVFKIVEKRGSKCYTDEYSVTRIYVEKKPSSASSVKESPKIEKFDNLQYSTVITDGAPVRESYSTYAERITHLPLNTILFIEGKYKDWYKIFANDNDCEYWIHEKNIKIIYPLNSYPVSSVQNVYFSKDKDFSQMKISLEFPILFKTQEENNNIYVTLLGIGNLPFLENETAKQEVFPGMKVVKRENNNLTLYIPSNSVLWGYEANYDGNNFIFRKRNTPNINKNYPLKNIIITIDPGHGGKELGTVGPTRIPEKEVNLKISTYLKKQLEAEGAKVIMTREDDSYVDLYRRPDIANENNSLICLSIHANSLVDKDPYEKHGVSTFYYHPQAKELAHQIKLQMMKDLKLKDDWHRRASFVLTRPTMPVSVLVEVAYMPNPEEYMLLTDENFQQKAAKSIVEGLKNYMRSITQQ